MTPHGATLRALLDVALRDAWRAACDVWRDVLAFVDLVAWLAGLRPGYDREDWGW